MVFTVGSCFKFLCRFRNKPLSFQAFLYGFQVIRPTMITQFSVDMYSTIPGFKRIKILHVDPAELASRSASQVLCASIDNTHFATRPENGIEPLHCNPLRSLRWIHTSRQLFRTVGGRLFCDSNLLASLGQFALQSGILCCQH